MLALLVDYHLGRGEKNFIVTLGMPLLRYYHEFKSYLHKSGPVTLICLQCAKSEVLRRIHERGRNPEQRQWEIDSLDRDDDYLDNFIHDNSFVRAIDNTKLNEDQVAERIIGLIRMSE